MHSGRDGGREGEGVATAMGTPWVDAEMVDAETVDGETVATEAGVTGGMLCSTGGRTALRGTRIGAEASCCGAGSSLGAAEDCCMLARTA